MKKWHIYLSILAAGLSIAAAKYFSTLNQETDDSLTTILACPNPVSCINDPNIRKAWHLYNDVVSEDHYDGLSFRFSAETHTFDEEGGTLDYKIIVENKRETPIKTNLEFDVIACGIKTTNPPNWPPGGCFYPPGHINEEINLQPGETTQLSSTQPLEHRYTKNTIHVLLPHAKLVKIGDFEIPYKEETSFGTLIPHKTNL